MFVTLDMATGKTEACCAIAPAIDRGRWFLAIARAARLAQELDLGELGTRTPFRAED
ncbi:MAG: hypothetical protein ACRELY_28580 [Polyangiaceae bacterium]